MPARPRGSPGGPGAPEEPQQAEEEGPFFPLENGTETLKTRSTRLKTASSPELFHPFPPTPPLHTQLYKVQ